MVGGSGLVVCTLAFYSDAQSSNPAEAMYRFNSVKCLKEVKFKNFRRMKGHFQKMFYLEVWQVLINLCEMVNAEAYKISGCQRPIYASMDIPGMGGTLRFN